MLYKKYKQHLSENHDTDTYMYIQYRIPVKIMICYVVR